jgi:hypothetical protein
VIKPASFFSGLNIRCADYLNPSHRMVASMPLCLFDRLKADFPNHWNRLVERRSRRVAHLLKNGVIPDGWTPTNSVNGAVLAISFPGRRCLGLRTAILRLGWQG